MSFSSKLELISKVSPSPEFRLRSKFWFLANPNFCLIFALILLYQTLQKVKKQQICLHFSWDSIFQYNNFMNILKTDLESPELNSEATVEISKSVEILVVQKFWFVQKFREKVKNAQKTIKNVPIAKF